MRVTQGGYNPQLHLPDYKTTSYTLDLQLTAYSLWQKAATESFTVTKLNRYKPWLMVNYILQKQIELTVSKVKNERLCFSEIDFIFFFIMFLNAMLRYFDSSLCLKIGI